MVTKITKIDIAYYLLLFIPICYNVEKADKLTTYREQRYHERVRHQNVEDMAVIRLMKQQRLRVHTLLSSGEVECRMYWGYDEAIDGMTRSVFDFFGGSGVVMVVEAFRRRFRERNSWKGREIKFLDL